MPGVLKGSPSLSYSLYNDLMTGTKTAAADRNFWFCMFVRRGRVLEMIQQLAVAQQQEH